MIFFILHKGVKDVDVFRGIAICFRFTRCRDTSIPPLHLDPLPHDDWNVADDDAQSEGVRERCIC